MIMRVAILLLLPRDWCFAFSSASCLPWCIDFDSDFVTLFVNGLASLGGSR